MWNPATIGDTGAGVSLIGSTLLETLPSGAVAHFQLSPLSLTNVSGADGGTLEILGSVSLMITISRVPFLHTFHIVKGNCDLLIIGNDFLTPRNGDVCMRPDQGDGRTGYIMLTHPKYGRIRLPLVAEPGGDICKTNSVAAAVVPEKQEPSPRVHMLFNTFASRLASRSEKIICVGFQNHSRTHLIRGT